MKSVVYYDRKRPEYPEKLRCQERMPEGLYVLGDLPDEGRKSVAIVGARSCSSYGRGEALRFSKALASRGVQIISGLAYGIDAWAHQGALECGGRTFAVLGCGADICYPKDNYPIYRKISSGGGGILSEFEPGTRPKPWHFPIRNRIISGLADLVLVVEARKKSGSLITADYALEQGKSVYAVPGRTGDELSAGCNALIAQGAGIACEPEALLEELGLFPEGGRNSEEMTQEYGQRLQGLTEEMRVIYQQLRSGEKNLEELQQCTGLETGILFNLILDLQLRGYIKQEITGYYCCCENE